MSVPAGPDNKVNNEIQLLVVIYFLSAGRFIVGCATIKVV